ncbi:MAG: hypothetical protein R6V17_05915, partial [Halanaerobacter sp.]
MRYKLITLITLVSLFLSAGVGLAQEIRGKITAVNESQETILLKERGEINEYRLSFDTVIKLNQKEVDLTALRPIDYQSFCEAKVELNQAGRVTVINAVYKTLEVIVTEVNKNSLEVNRVETKGRRTFKINDRVEMMRNNLPVDLNDISPGDRGLIILGLNNRLQKVILHHYQSYGFLKEINPAQREIVLNIGTRLNPAYKTLSLTSKT